jgi:hypothetical protein
MLAEQVVKNGLLEYECPKSYLKFWRINNDIWVTYHNSRWDFRRNIADRWGSVRKIESIIEFQKGMFPRTRKF